MESIGELSPTQKHKMDLLIVAYIFAGAIVAFLQDRFGRHRIIKPTEWLAACAIWPLVVIDLVIYQKSETRRLREQRRLAELNARQMDQVLGGIRPLTASKKQ